MASASDSEPAQTTVVVGGLPVHVFSDGALDALAGDAALLFLLHGRGGAAAQLAPVVRGVFGALAGRTGARTLLVATCDQRNHGERLVSAAANTAWKDGNDRHAVDMYAMQTGTARDVSYLIDFLPSYLFPTGKTQITDWLVGGISLGGHATWISLRHEPRISVGIPIIGCPDYLKLIGGRATESGVPFAPPYMPSTLRTLIEQYDPAQADYSARAPSNPFLGKKILVLSGADDPVVPWRCSEEFVERLDVGPDGVKKVVAYPGVGHECTPEMVKEMAAFVWENVLKVT